jgi:outer membrane translocation and assembly module TamA
MVEWRKVVIERLNFDGPIHLSRSDVAGITREANQKMLDADDPGWIKGFTEISLRDAWLTHGYFKVNVTAQARSLGGNSSKERFLVTAQVEEGLQYHLGNIRFVGGSIFPERELRAAFPIHDGEVLNVGLIRNGIDALTELYASQGYIDFAPVPDDEIDDNLRQISVVFHLDEQKQYRVGKVEIKASDPRLEASLKGLAVPGKIFNSEAVENFFRENKSVLPLGQSRGDEMYVYRNIEAGIVDLAFDIRNCP